MSKVKLAVRVRPFTDRELKSEKERVSVIDVIDNNTITITNLKVSVSGAGDSRERVRRYDVDFTFDSSCSMLHPSYATQEKVFETIGREVVAGMSRGCSACVLAYGQSATGKTHTMMGTDAQPGLVPRLCKALADHQPVDITVSFLEIYNERVHDLLVGESAPIFHSLPRRRGNSRKDLRVREHPSRGPYVQNLRRVAVNSVEALLLLVAEGARRRRTAATKRNSTSSRSHALLEIATPTATLHLADLAGSEKASWEGCGGGRQKEGANINKSLVALSNVISALVNGGTGRGRFVPYRDSALTWLLKDCFTGGANTYIIATVSPSVSCYGESASTLRWAARARQLPAPRTLSCVSNVTSRAALQAQINQLLAELTRNFIRYIPETGKLSYDDHHWDLQVIKTTNQQCDMPNKVANIGNIMNIIHPKTDANNSESTASSVASGSSDIINTMDRNMEINSEINKEVDKLFGPALERTSSSSDLKLVAPLRHKRRQYRSQEVLPLDETLIATQSNSLNTLPSQNENRITVIQDPVKNKVPHVSILHENQRAEIVASVTERLYSRLKKKEESAVSKMESMVDRKIMEPLSELKICTNARQRLMELSKKALRNKRRIGIPAFTQTKTSAIRVKDQAIDIQTDLESYVVQKPRSHTVYRDASTETTPMTPRYKEIAVGSKYGTLDFHDRSTITETKKIVQKNSFMMTDMLAKRDRCTQTQVVPPPRRKKRLSNISKYISSDNKNNCDEESISAPIITINISQTYPIDSESQSSDDNLRSVVKNSFTMTPDLLTNHNSAENRSDNTQSTKENNVLPQSNEHIVVLHGMKDSLNLECKNSEEFPDAEDYLLPRVTVDPTQKQYQAGFKNMILGRNSQVYPYNIVLSPPKERDSSKRIVKFKDVDVGPEISDYKDDNNDNSNKSISSTDMNTSEKENSRDSLENTQPDSTESSQIETDSFIWSKSSTANRTMGCLRKSYTPVYKSNARYKTAKARLYREYLGLENEVNDKCESYSLPHESIKGISSSDSAEIDDGYQYKFRRRRQFLEDKFSHDTDAFTQIERKIFDSCNDLERSVKKYERCLTNFRDDKNCKANEVSTRTPTEYLQHLVQLRREAVKAESETTDIESSLSYK